MIADRIVALIDYSDYLEQQNEWVAGLVRLAQSSEPEKARELAEIIAETLRRSVSLARLNGQIVYLPAGPGHRKLDKFVARDTGPELAAASNHSPLLLEAGRLHKRQ